MADVPTLTAEELAYRVVALCWALEDSADDAEVAERVEVARKNACGEADNNLWIEVNTIDFGDLAGLIRRMFPDGFILTSAPRHSPPPLRQSPAG